MLLIELLLPNPLLEPELEPLFRFKFPPELCEEFCVKVLTRLLLDEFEPEPPKLKPELCVLVIVLVVGLLMKASAWLVLLLPLMTDE